VSKLSEILGRPLNSALKYKDQMIAAGYENVQEVLYKWPSNQWPKDRKVKEIGPPSLPLLQLSIWCFSDLNALVCGLD
jgi:hypothetical protein